MRSYKHEEIQLAIQKAKEAVATGTKKGYNSQYSRAILAFVLVRIIFCFVFWAGLFYKAQSPALVLFCLVVWPSPLYTFL